MLRSRMNALGTSGLTLVFVGPDTLDRLIECGQAQSRVSYIGSDREYEDESSGGVGLAIGDDEAEAKNLTGLEDAPDPFYDLMEVAADSREDDPTDDLLHRIGALSNGGKR